ncbi:MAG: hypothetical protein U0835_21920 [Isosphaeraceae bacterium]
MIRLQGPGSTLCDGLTRRELLRVGGLSLGGLSLPTLLESQAQARAGARAGGKAKNCIILF